AYAYARTGYHRGLDQLRRAGWRGHGPGPWEHEPNRGFLRSLHALGPAAAAPRGGGEAGRWRTLPRGARPPAPPQLEGFSRPPHRPRPPPAPAPRPPPRPPPPPARPPPPHPPARPPATAASQPRRAASSRNASQRESAAAAGVVSPGG